jgi:hypothetical protein
MSHLCQCKEPAKVTLGPERVSGEQIAVCPTCHGEIFRSVRGRKVLKVAVVKEPTSKKP